MFVRAHHERVNCSNFPREAAAEQEVLTELQIFTTVNRYLELQQTHPDKDECLSILRNEARTGAWDANTVDALIQLRQDETFIKAMKSGR